MNIAELDLQEYDVMELAPDDAGEIEGGIVLGSILLAYLVGVATSVTAVAIVDSINNPDDFMDGYNAATS